MKTQPTCSHKIITCSHKIIVHTRWINVTFQDLHLTGSMFLYLVVFSICGTFLYFHCVFSIYSVFLYLFVFRPFPCDFLISSVSSSQLELSSHLTLHFLLFYNLYGAWTLLVNVLKCLYWLTTDMNLICNNAVQLLRKYSKTVFSYFAVCTCCIWNILLIPTVK